MKRALVLIVAMLLASPVAMAQPSKTRAAKVLAKPAKAVVAKAADKDKKKKAATTSRARVAFGKGGELRPAREVIGRREEPLTLEEDIAKQIEKLLRGPLRNGITGLYVADARSGEPLFAVNSDDPLNPASNVKMVSTATALELLGPTFRYTTRVLGPEPDAAGVVHGNLYLLGTWDPTLAAGDIDDLAQKLTARGVKQLDGNVLSGSDPTRDGIFRAVVPIAITAGEPGQPPTATTPAGFDLVTVDVTAKTEKRARKRPKLTYKQELTTDAAGHKRIKLTIGGTIGKGGETMYALYTKERTAVAAHQLRAALRAYQVVVNGDISTIELGDFIGDQVGSKGLPVELARHESQTLGDIVTRVNKWSINWLADRVVMTAAALSRRTTPSMDVAIDAMYAWMQRHANLSKDSVVIDTGSGLSYRTRITPHELVAIVRSAGGFAQDGDQAVAKAWLGSLSIAGTDGTLRHRFRVPEIQGHIHAKTGTLSTAIALTGVLDLDPTRPLAFSIITNSLRPLRKGYVRKAHEQLVALLAKYVVATAKPTSLPAGTPITFGKPTTSLPAINETAVTVPDEIAEPQFDPELDVETSTSK
ncbi:MAG TPA: D-alanyl-D-alanine carboxypeptidase [Kofleriaceae bacterium]|nr:D-alanyl-D-alanine carboxypeptidase [Kofleriaceae bacterium]